MEWNGYAYEMWESTDERLQGKWFFRIFGKSSGDYPDDQLPPSWSWPMLSGYYESEGLASEALDRKIKDLRVWECKTPEEVRKVMADE